MMRNITIPVLAVLITITQPSQPIGCAPPQPPLSRNEDGSYTRPAMTVMTLQQCYSDARSWQEEWTDYPEKGGTFLRMRPNMIKTQEVK